MKLNIRKILPLALIAVILLSAGCKKIENIKLTSYHLDSYSLVGLRALDIDATVGVDNPAMEFTLVDPQVIAYRNGVALGTLNADPVTVSGRTIATYKVHGRLTLDPNVSIMQVISYATHFKKEEYTLDISSRVKIKGGGQTKITRTNVPLTELMK